MRGSGCLATWRFLVCLDLAYVLGRYLFAAGSAPFLVVRPALVARGGF